MDAGFRLDGIPALDSWDLIVAVLHGNTYQSRQKRGEPYKSPTQKKFHGMIDDLHNVDFIHSNVHSSRKEALLCIFEAVIKMIIKVRSPTKRHVSGTHRVGLDWLLTATLHFGTQIYSYASSHEDTRSKSISG